MPTEPVQTAGIRIAQAQHFLCKHNLPLGVPEHRSRIEIGAADGELASDYRAVRGPPFEAWGPARRELKVCVVGSLDQVGGGGG